MNNALLLAILLASLIACNNNTVKTNNDFSKDSSVNTKTNLILPDKKNDNTIVTSSTGYWFLFKPLSQNKY